MSFTKAERAEAFFKERQGKNFSEVCTDAQQNIGGIRGLRGGKSPQGSSAAFCIEVWDNKFTRLLDRIYFPENVFF